MYLPLGEPSSTHNIYLGRLLLFDKSHFPFEILSIERLQNNDSEFGHKSNFTLSRPFNILQ